MTEIDINLVVNPIYWSTAQLISYGHDTIHELALNAAGTINSYHLVIGRCLLAVQRTKLYELFGCSGAVHYGTQVLGLRAKQARSMRRVAEKLEVLPLLSRACELGQVSWSVLREVVQKATPVTEEYWLALCLKKNYHEMAQLVRHTPKDGLPGDLPAEGDKEPALSELRLQLGITARTVIDRGLQVFALAQGRPVALAEAVEMLFAKLLQKESATASELDALTKSQQAARKDLWADHCRREPLLREARELAQRMGLANPDHEGAVNNLEDPEVSLDQIAHDLLESMLPEMPSDRKANQRPAPDISAIFESGECPARDMSSSIETPQRPARDKDIQWEELLRAHQVECPEDADVILLANDWRNRRLRENQDARVPTPAQKHRWAESQYCPDYRTPVHPSQR